MQNQFSSSAQQWISFLISLITLPNSNSRVLISTNRITIDPDMVIPNGINCSWCYAQKKFSWYVHSITWISLRAKLLTVTFVEGSASHFVFVMSRLQEPMGTMKTINSDDCSWWSCISGDDLTCLHFFTFGWEVWYFSQVKL